MYHHCDYYIQIWIAPLMSHSRLQKAGPPLHSILPPDVSGPTTNKMDLKELLGGFSFFVR